MTLSGEGAGSESAGTADRLETIGDDTWEDFFGAPFSVLMLATTTCPICKKWTKELTEWLAADERWRHVRFGRLSLNAGGVSSFKGANRAWLKDLPGVPYSVFLVAGERRASLPGRGVKRLVRRLERVQSEQL